ncbi:MAG: Uncharacterised protein [Chloroflexota bacterium]|nr:MAG: Uncharacterised protein [Chloroflexota bacterium]
MGSTESRIFSALRTKILSTGTTVKATAVDANNAKLTEIANGVKNCPTSPSMKVRGINTATVVKVEDTIAAPTSLVASIAASYLDSPICMCR